MFDSVSEHHRYNNLHLRSDRRSGARGGRHDLEWEQSGVCGLLLHLQLGGGTVQLPGGLPRLSAPGQAGPRGPRQAAGVQAPAPVPHPGVYPEGVYPERLTR